MIDYYNAFISYRHADLDSKVAEDVQRSLEHFPVPRAIQKKIGKKKIERIFRDKDELPITSDLTDTISNALEKADFLIVICSPNTCESFWVQREIEFFLKNHTKDQILTVLADGEPNDVIPEILKSDDKVIIEADGSERTIKVSKEPLSCDYRMPFRRAHKEEIPRLAAAVLGCSYDELVRRQRAYKARRLIALTAGVAVAALVFGAYMWNSKRQVSEALRQANIEKSRYLAIQSDMLLDEGHRIGAIYLGLAALPDDLNDTEAVTSEAVSSLVYATNAYRSMAGANVDSVWNYNTNAIVTKVVVNEDGTRMAALDTLGSIFVWDTESHELLFTVMNMGVLNGEMMFIGDDKLLLLSAESLSAYDSTTGEQLWELVSNFEDPVSLFIASPIQVMQDGNIMVCASSKTLAVVDPSDGSIVERYDVRQNFEGAPASYSEFQISPDNSKVAFIIYSSFDSGSVSIYDLRTDSFVQADDFNLYVSKLAWYDNDHLVVSAYELDAAESSVFIDTYYMSPNNTSIYCLDGDDLSLNWETNHVSVGFSNYRKFITLPAVNAVAFYSGASLISYDIDDGSVLHEWVANDSIVDVSDRDGDGRPLIITSGGGLALPAQSMGENVLGLTYEFVSDLSAAVVNHGVYVFTSYSNEITYYNSGVVDEEWVQTDDVVTTSFRDYYMDDDILAVMWDSTVTMVDPNTNELIDEVEIHNGTGSYFNLYLLGAYDGNLYVLDGSQGVTLNEIDMERGTVDQIQIFDGYSTDQSYARLADGKVFYLRYEDSQRQFCIYDIDSGDTEVFELNVESFVDIPVVPMYIDEMGLIYVASSAGDFIIDVEEGIEIRVRLPEEWNDTIAAAADPVNDHVIIADGGQILFINSDGDIDYSISTEGNRPLGMDIITNESDGTRTLLVPYSNGTLARYNPATYELEGVLDISTYEDYVSDVEFQVDWENNYLYLNFRMLTDVINMNSWVEEAAVENSFGHHNPTDRFYTTYYSVSEERMIGYFRHYTVQELVDRAYAILGENTEITEDLRVRYGL